MIKTLKIQKNKNKYFINNEEIDLDVKAHVFFTLNNLEEYRAIVSDRPFEFSRSMELSNRNKKFAEKLFNREINKLYVK